MAALAWERERAAADASALQVAEAERFLRASPSRQAPPAGSGARYDPTDPMVAQLHLQAAGVQNIRALVSVLLDPASSSYGRWRPEHQGPGHRPPRPTDVGWLRLDSVAMS